MFVCLFVAVPSMNKNKPTVENQFTGIETWKSNEMQVGLMHLQSIVAFVATKGFEGGHVSAGGQSSAASETRLTGANQL